MSLSPSASTVTIVPAVASTIPRPSSLTRLQQKRGMAAPSLAPVPGDAGQQRATPSAPISPSKLSHFIQLFAPSSQPTTAGGSPLKKLELSGSGARLRGGSLTHGSFESRRGSKSSSTESYGHRGHRTRSGTLPTSDSGGIGELSHAARGVDFRREELTRQSRLCNM